MWYKNLFSLALITSLLAGCADYLTTPPPSVPTSLTLPLDIDPAPSELAELIAAEINYSETVQATFHSRYIELLRDLTRQYEVAPIQDGTAFQFGAYRFFSRTLAAQSEGLLVRAYGSNEDVVLDLSRTSPGENLNTLAISSDGERIAYTTSNSSSVVRVLSLKSKKLLEIKRDLPISEIAWGDDTLFLLESEARLRGIQVSECSLITNQCRIRQQVAHEDEQLLIRRLDDRRIVESHLISPRGESTLVLHTSPPSTQICQAGFSSDTNQRQIDFGALLNSQPVPIVRQIQNFCSATLVLASCGTADCIYIAKAGTRPIAIDLPKQLQSVTLSPNPDRHSRIANIAIETLVTPSKTFQIDLAAAKLIDSAAITSASPCQQSELTVVARDKTEIPVSLCLPPKFKPPGRLLVLVYGAYGTPLRAHYSPSWKLLLESGIGLALAHVRGGGEFGDAWHRAGAGQNKHRSSEDLIDVAQALIQRSITSTSQLGAWARSAGALTLASAIARAPTLFKAVILVVPFIQPHAANDPLRESERDEWDEINPINELNLLGRSNLPAALLFIGARDEVVNPLGAIRWLHLLRALSQNNLARIISLSPTRDHISESNSAAQMESAALETAFLSTVLSAK